MKNKRKIILIVCILFLIVILALASSYALFTFNITKNTNFKITIGSLELSIEDTTTEDKFIMENTVPTKDQVALGQDGYTFTITNTGTMDSYYTVYLDDILLDNNLERLENNSIRFQLFNHTTNKGIIDSLSNSLETEKAIATGYLKEGESITYTLRMWIDYNAGNEAQNKYFAVQIRVVGLQQNTVIYQESILNGADPVLSSNLIPVTIDDDGTVKKADTSKEWYSYEKKNWANAIVLKDNSTQYKNNSMIPEENIESYFVWIPRYKYKLFDTTGSQAIDIIFGDKNASPSNGSNIGEYLTHPAFQAFDSNGLWVGKFETGYDGAESTTGAEVNSSDSSKIVIKPNVYSWRSITIGNMFEASYNYLRNDESHMLKNTEWGAVAYLTSSNYGRCTNGSCSEVRINNNESYITGYASVKGIEESDYTTEGTNPKVDETNTINYLNSNSVLASTTGNRSGIYDMSGGAWEYVMGYTTGASTVGGSSGITTIHPDFFTNPNWNKYYDQYTATTNTDYNNRILGDATGELGPFNSYRSSWYQDYASFVYSSSSWFARGGHWNNSSAAGVFSFGRNTGDVTSNISFRIVLIP